VKRVLLDATTLKISKPGFDVDTAGISDLLLYLGANFGQILEMGLAFLPEQGVGTPSYHRATTINIGPYDAVPEAFVCGVTNGAITVPPHFVDSYGFMRAYFELVYSVSQTQLYIAAHRWWTGPPELIASYALYIIYRRTF